MPDSFTAAAEYADLLREAGFDTVTAVFEDDRVRVWRSLADRENATVDLGRRDGKTIRFHLKRYPAANLESFHGETQGLLRLTRAGVPTAPLAASGTRTDGRSFVLFADLTGYTPADKWLNAGNAFESVLAPTADLAAQLHAARLHHRDLYLCHFMVRPDPFDLRLIDVARVGQMSNPLTRRRWIVKDLAQFWYSTTKHDVTDEQRARWLARYAERRGVGTGTLAGAVGRKAAAIARHDARLNRRQPNRNVSIPTS